MKSEKSQPSQAEIQSYLVESTNTLLRCGAGKFLKEKSERANQVLAKYEFDDYYEMKKDVDEFYCAELPLAVRRQDSLGGSLLSICKIKPDGEALYEEALVVGLDNDGYIKSEFEYLCGGNKALRDKVLELDQIQSDMGWQPTIPDKNR